MYICIGYGAARIVQGLVEKELSSLSDSIRRSSNAYSESGSNLDFLLLDSRRFRYDQLVEFQRELDFWLKK